MSMVVWVSCKNLSLRCLHLWPHFPSLCISKTLIHREKDKQASCTGPKARRPQNWVLTCMSTVERSIGRIFNSNMRIFFNNAWHLVTISYFWPIREALAYLACAVIRPWCRRRGASALLHFHPLQCGLFPLETLYQAALRVHHETIIYPWNVPWLLLLLLVKCHFSCLYLQRGFGWYGNIRVCDKVSEWIFGYIMIPEIL